MESRGANTLPKKVAANMERTESYLSVSLILVHVLVNYVKKHLVQIVKVLMILFQMKHTKLSLYPR